MSHQQMTTTPTINNKFSVQYCHRGLLQGKPSSIDSPQPQQQFSPPRTTTHRRSPTSCTHQSQRGAIRPILGFRPDLDRIHQQQLIQLHREQQHHHFTDSNAKISTFYISCDPKTGKFKVNDEDLKFRLKLLAVASFQFHANLRKLKQQQEKLQQQQTHICDDGEILSLTPEALRNEQNKNSSSKRKGTNTTGSKSDIGRPGSLEYTRTLIGDIDIMFHHCMTSEDVGSPEEGAAVAFRHTLDQMAKANLFDHQE